MPSFPLSSNVPTYCLQVVPPPHGAWVRKDASRGEIVFSDDRKFTSPGADGEKVLSTVEYKEMLCLSRRMVDVRSHVYRLKWKKKHEKNWWNFMRLANFVTMTASMRMTPQLCFSMKEKNALLIVLRNFW